jgi:hypothetical protein
MKSQTDATLNRFIYRRVKPSGYIDRAARHQLAEMLVWLWSVVLLLSLLSVFALDSVWLGQALLIAGVVISIALFRRAQARRMQRVPVPHLSGASKCVWQMDREG